MKRDTNFCRPKAPLLPSVFTSGSLASTQSEVSPFASASRAGNPQCEEDSACRRQCIFSVWYGVHLCRHHPAFPLEDSATSPPSYTICYRSPYDPAIGTCAIYSTHPWVVASPVSKGSTSHQLLCEKGRECRLRRSHCLSISTALPYCVRKKINDTS